MNVDTIVAFLDDLESLSVDAAHSFWFGKQATAGRRGKAPRIEAIAEVLADPRQVEAAIRTWPTELRQAIAVAHASGDDSVAALEAALAGAGLVHAIELLAELVVRGVLLPLPGVYSGKVHARNIHRTPDRRLRLLPAAAAIAGPPPRIPLPLASVPDAEVLTVFPADPGVLVGDVLRVAALTGRRRLRTNSDGWPGAPLVAAVAKELGHPGLLPLMVALDGGALTIEGGMLAPAELLAQNLPLDALVGMLFGNFSDAGRWCDDAAGEHGPELGELGYAGWREPTDAERIAARRFLAAALRRLEATGWVRVDDLVDHVLALAPALGRRQERWTSASAGVSERANQRRLLAAIVTRTFHAFGLVDVGACVEDAELPRRGAPQGASDGDFRDESRAAYDVAERKKPIWKPQPSPFVLRVTPLGRRVLDPETAPAPAPAVRSRGLHVGVDFEVVAHRKDADPGLLFQLDNAAVALPGAATDPVRRWRLDRERWLDALEGGLEAEVLLAALAEASDRPLPENVLETVRGWTAQFGRTRLFAGFDLAEFSSVAELDAAIVGVAEAVRVGPTQALVPSGWIEGRVIDNGRAARCLTVDEDTVVHVDLAAADLGLPRHLRPYARQEAPDRWRLDRALAPRGRSERVLGMLELRSQAPLPMPVVARVRAWCGELPAARAERVEVVQVAADVAAGLAALPEVAPHVRGVLPGGLLVVTDGRRKALVKALEALGVRVEEGLAFG